MFILKPEEQVVGFSLIEWITEGEPAPKRAMKTYLKERYGLIAGLGLAASAKLQNGDQDSSDDEEEDEHDDEEESDASPRARELLLDTVYDSFSLAENGDVLLESNKSDVSLLVTGIDAEQLLPILRAKLEERAKKIQKLFQR